VRDQRRLDEVRGNPPVEREDHKAERQGKDALERPPMAGIARIDCVHDRRPLRIAGVTLSFRGEAVLKRGFRLAEARARAEA
jgi:hypothetical protein